MNNTKKILLFFIILIELLLFVPNVCNAESESASNEETLKEAISKANKGEIDTITLTESITLTGPLTEVEKNLTIDGKGFSISGSDSWYETGGSSNQSIITSIDGILTLKNLILKHGPKQGAQAYGNGHLILDGVTISDCKYSGLIANGGIIEIRDLNLNTTGGIEVGKSTTNPINTNPKIIMNGTLKTTSKAIIYEDSKTKAQLTIENKEESTDKLFITKDSIFITDSNNTVIYESQNLSDIDIKNSEMDEENFVTVTINYNEKTKKIIANKNETLSKYNLSDIKNIDGKIFVNFVKANNDIFSEDTPITDNIELTAIYKDPEPEPDPDPEPEQPSQDIPTVNTTQDETPNLNNPKDITPKTGNSNYLGIGFVILSIFILSIIFFKRKF